MILITGASSGFGEATARLFAAQKKDLILVARRRERLEALAAELRSAHGVRCELFTLDVRDRAAVFAWGDANRALLEEVTVLVNNAGLARGLSSIQDGNPDDWDEMIDTNVKGLLYVTRVIAPLMAKARRGHIVNVGSTAGYWVYPKGNVYNASKFAVRALNEGMRMDLAGTGVRVTEIAPGLAETEFSKVRLRDDAKASAVYAGIEPLTAHDIAESIAWVVSRPARVNVQELVVMPTDQASVTMVNRRG